MTRISAISAPWNIDRIEHRLRSMLATYPGAVECDGSIGALLGVARQGHGGIAVHPRGVLVLDGVLFDFATHQVDSGVQGDDAAVLAELIARYGFVEALKRVNGDLAAVWFDRQSKSLWLGRDPFGMRPLYFARLGEGSWAASSQPRGLLTLDSVPNTPNRDFLIRYGSMHYRMIDNDPDRSPYEAISQVPAAHAVELRSTGGLSQHRYWSLKDTGDFESSEAELAEQYRSLLTDSVRIRLDRYPRRAFTLSGGMDSSSILASAVSIEKRSQIAFSTLYEDSTYDERIEISDMLQGNVSEWRQVMISDSVDVVGGVDQLLRVHDEPVATATWLSHLRLCAEASNSDFDAIFGGLGGDELNAGEYEYFPLHFADLRNAGRHSELEMEVSAWAHHHDHAIFKKTPEVARELMDRLSDPAHPGVCLPDLPRMLRYLHVLKPGLSEYQNHLPKMETIFDSCLKNRTWQDLSRETTPCCIRAEDRHGSEYGLPPVLPFLDKRLVEFMFQVPGSMKIRDGVTKRLLREAMEDVLPEATRSRIKKTGWNAPAHLWFSGPGADLLRDLVYSSEFDSLGIYDRGEVLKIIDDHDRIVSTGAIQDNHMMFLWPFFNLMRWQTTLMHQVGR